MSLWHIYDSLSSWYLHDSVIGLLIESPPHPLLWLSNLDDSLSLWHINDLMSHVNITNSCKYHELISHSLSLWHVNDLMSSWYLHEFVTNKLLVQFAIFTWLGDWVIIRVSSIIHVPPLPLLWLSNLIDKFKITCNHWVRDVCITPYNLWHTDDSLSSW